MTRRAKTRITAFLCLILCAVPVLLTGGAKKETEGTEMEKRAGQTLCGVSYHYASGMVYGEEFRIELTPEQIVSASYFPWEGIEDYTGEETDCITIENQPIDSSQWEAIEQAVMELLPVLKAQEPKKEKLIKWWNKWWEKRLEVLDGGDICQFSLTWRAEDGSEQTVYYVIPSDSRFYTLLDLMKETVHPIGRAIGQSKDS